MLGESEEGDADLAESIATRVESLGDAIGSLELMHA